jgi:hypothetical protein
MDGFSYEISNMQMRQANDDYDDHAHETKNKQKHKAYCRRRIIE